MGVWQKKKGGDQKMMRSIEIEAVVESLRNIKYCINFEYKNRSIINIHNFINKNKNKNWNNLL